MTDEELIEQFQILTQGVASMLEESEKRMKVYIENAVTKRIDSLFDGYKLTHEKQWELEHRTEILQQQFHELQTRLSVIENKIA